MSEVLAADAATREAIIEAETARQAALLRGDIVALDALFEESLVHVHAPGLVHNKAQLLEHVKTRQAYLGMRRGELNIRVSGDMAVMTGELVNRLRSPGGGERTIAGAVIQVLHRGTDGQWRFISFQMTPYGEHVWKATEAESAQIKAREAEADAAGSGAAGAANAADAAPAK